VKTAERVDEALEFLWETLEEGQGGEGVLPQLQRLETSIEELAREGLLMMEGGSLRLTDAGRDAAREVIRRHRLSERLLHDVLETGGLDMEEAACQVEHVIRKGIEEKVCQLLGHPDTCPHGRPIPPGPCCDKARADGETFVAPLTRLKKGEQGVIAYLRTSDAKKTQKLMAMGVMPGSPITLDRAFPSFVFTVGYSQYAVDADMAGAILVRRQR
jgi:DtxR family Mn-dependent transcriptional regulator